jgi:spore coat protein U-like protein
MEIKKSAIIFATFLALAITPAFAKTFSTTFHAFVNVPAECTLHANDLDFGSYNRTNGNKSQTTVAVNCTSGATYKVGINWGTNNLMAGSGRELAGPNASLLNYNLYTDSNYQTVWMPIESGANQSGLISAVGTGIDQLYTIYGEIPKGQNPKQAGEYSDTLVVTIAVDQ